MKRKLKFKNFLLWCGDAWVGGRKGEREVGGGGFSIGKLLFFVHNFGIKSP